MKEFRHLGTYGIIIQDEKILLINKFGGPYNGKLDLPGGTIEFKERPIETLKREMLEEVGIEIVDCELFDTDSVAFEWKYEEELLMVHHIGIFYKVLEYKNEISTVMEVDSINDDSLGADWYLISSLKKEQLSAIAIIELTKLGYNLD